MKKIFTLLVVCITAISAMAQMHGAMNFIGNSEFYLPDMKDNTLTQTVKDTVSVTMGDNSQSITVPDMTYAAFNMTIKSFTVSDLSYTMTGSYATGDMAFEWNADNFTTTTTGTDGFEKTIIGSNLKAKYTHSTGEFSLEVTFQYGAMPYLLTYSIDGFYTIDNAWKLAGRGTQGNPYRIFDAADFTAMATNYNAETNTGKGEYFLMMNDIDFGGSAENPVQFPAIAKNGDLAIANITGGFDGTFDGGNHTISGIYHTNVSMDAKGKYNGLFSFVDKDGVIKNIVMGKENTLAGYNYVGAIASINQGTIENCYNYADITAANFAAAGICGYMVKGNGTVKNSENHGNITAMTYTSGICGGSQSGTSVTTYNYLVENCINYGNMSTTNGVGAAGIVGSYSGAVKNCTNYGDADDTKGTAKSRQYTAGIVSCITYPTTIEDCTNYGAIKGVNNVGGIVGCVFKGDNTEFTIKNCTNNGAVSAEGENIAGIIGNSKRDAGMVTVEGCTNNGVVTSTGTTELLGNIRGSETITIGEGNTIADNLDNLPLDVTATGIEDITTKDNTAITDGKYLKNGKLVIVKDGKTYNVLGIEQ